MTEEVGDFSSNREIIRSEMKKLLAEEREQILAMKPPSPPGEISGGHVVDAYHNEEDGDAYLFVRLFAGKWVYDYALEKWFHFKNHTWEMDEVDQVVAEVKGVVDLYLREAENKKKEAGEAMKEGNSSLSKAFEEMSSNLIARGRKLQKAARKDKVIRLARSGVGTLGIDGKKWDTDPYVLGCPNGVIDLKTGHLRDGRPEDYIKTMCPTQYLGIDEPCPAWEKFLSEVFNGDLELISYVQRLFGYSLMGLSLEHIFPVLQGQGRNGKGTMLETFHHILGPLAGPIDAEMLLSQFQPRSSAAPSPDIVDLRGKRLIWASETDEGRKLSLSKIKWLTGGDTLKCRPPNGKVMIEFRPSHTLFLLTNPLPHAPGDDYALWERIRIIHFPFSFVDDPQAENERKQDKFLLERLKAEASGILSWLVRGCLEWRKNGGLGSAEAIQVETTKYHGEQDIVGQFLEECTVRDELGYVSAKNLYAAYRRWCLSSGMNVKTSTWFGKQVKKRPDIDYEKSSTINYIGIKLLEAQQGEGKQETIHQD